MKYRIFRPGLFTAILVLSWSLAACGLEEALADGGSTFQEENTGVPAAPQGAGTEEEPTAFGRVTVHIAGAVVHPGVYEIDGGSRLFDAVTIAGGFCEGAAEGYCNLAAVLEDGRQYTIPYEEELAEGTGEMPAAEADGKVDINRAGVSELTALSGIGESRAKAIIAYREEHGEFRNTEDIMKVSGIGEGLFTNIRDEITVR
ncbi:MAG: helix-hairpin-helix domain-containing protein [Lachnospiraceae bacterium]|nr:helix-hairpin-helix domain-containing protein [Lachnospiraceae bacterium]